MAGRKLTLWDTILIYGAVPIVANITAAFSADFLIMPIMMPDSIDRYYHDMVNPLVNITIQFISYGLPTVLVMLYIKPLMGFIGQYRYDQAAQPDQLQKRRVLNAPLMISLITFTGWLSNFILRTFFYWPVFDSLGLLGLVFLLITTLAIASFCFVICYYLMDMLSRHIIVPFFFSDHKISGIPGTIHLTVWIKFLIFVFAVSAFPLAVLLRALSVILKNPSIQPQVMIFSALFMVLSLPLVFMFSRSFQLPLEEMKNATDRIRKGDFDVNVTVKAGDELGVLGESLNQMARELQDKSFMMDTFGKIVDPAVRDYLLKSNASLGGELRETTILFTDLRGFTNMSEQLKPTQIVEVLNDYFERMSACISREKGLVNKYIGDAIMAVYNAPLELPNHADAALRSAIAMQTVLPKLNEGLRARNLPQLGTGIGIHTGEVLSGNIGASSRMEYTVIGDSVNLASRLEGLTRYYGAQVVISGQTFARLEDPSAYQTRFMGKVKVKGKREPVSVFELLNGQPDEVVEKRLKNRAEFEKALHLYYSADFARSAELLQAIASDDPADQAVQMYCRKCAACLENGVTEGWDGVEALTVK